MQYKKIPGLRLWYKWVNCPWQIKTTSAILDIGGRAIGEKWGWKFWADGGMGRFGGGWLCKAGVVVGKASLIVEWVFGSLRVTWKDPKV